MSSKARIADRFEDIQWTQEKKYGSAFKFINNIKIPL